jgi:hypothetical protein
MGDFAVLTVETDWVMIFCTLYTQILGPAKLAIVQRSEHLRASPFELG